MMSEKYAQLYPGIPIDTQELLVTCKLDSCLYMGRASNLHSFSPAICYSFSWRQNPNWTTLHPPGPEIVNYLHDTCSHFKILDKIQTDIDVTNIHWLEDEQEWEVTLVHLAPGVGDLSIQERKDRVASGGASRLLLRSEKARAKVIVSAVGGLVEPNLIPDIPGIKSFQGDLVHAAKWDPKIEVAGKDVIVVGTGCSGAQIVPEFVKPKYRIKSITQLLRTPGWVEPNAFSKRGTDRWEKWSPRLSRIPGVQNLLRLLIFCGIEATWFNIFVNSQRGKKERPKAERRLLRHMRKKVPDKYHELLTPNYALGCKRRVIEGDWFSSLNDPRVELTSNPLTSIEPDGVILGPGRHWPPMDSDSKYPTEQRKKHADIIVFANGYNVGQTMFQLPVIGRSGKSLMETWEEGPGPGAYLGTACHGFPNFFMLVGPNTATGHSSIILQTENAVNYALNFIAPVVRGDVEAYEVREDAEEEYTATIQRQLKNTVWSHDIGGCNSWYRGPNGWNSTTYP